MPVSTSNIRSIKMDIAAMEENRVVEKQNLYTQKKTKITSKLFYLYFGLLLISVFASFLFSHYFFHTTAIGCFTKMYLILLKCHIKASCF